MANKLVNMAVQTSSLGTELIAQQTQAGMRAVIGVNSGGGVGSVDSVNGQVGDVVLAVSDLENDAGYITNADIPDAPVISVNGKSGVVTLNASEVGAVPTSAVGSTIATLVGGLVPNSQIPPLAITSTFVVSTQAAQLALAAQEGDVCVRTDQAQSYIKTNSNLGNMSDWQILLSPTAPVQSVNGKTGAVSLNNADVGAAAAVHTHANATASAAGFMAATDKAKLDSLLPAAVSNIEAVRNTSIQTIPPGVYTQVQYNTVTRDTLGEFSGAVFTPKQSGLYLISAAVLNTSAAAPGTCGLRVRQGANNMRLYTATPVSGDMITGTRTFNLVAATPVYIDVYYTNGGEVYHDPGASFVQILRIK